MGRTQISRQSNKTMNNYTKNTYSKYKHSNYILQNNQTTNEDYTPLQTAIKNNFIIWQINDKQKSDNFILPKDYFPSTKSRPLFQFCVNVKGSKCKTFIEFPQVLPTVALQNEIDFYMQKLKQTFEQEKHKCILNNNILTVTFCDDGCTAEYILRDIAQKSNRNQMWNFGIADIQND